MVYSKEANLNPVCQRFSMAGRAGGEVQLTLTQLQRREWSSPRFWFLEATKRKVNPWRSAIPSSSRDRSVLLVPGRDQRLFVVHVKSVDQALPRLPVKSEDRLTLLDFVLLYLFDGALLRGCCKTN